MRDCEDHTKSSPENNYVHLLSANYNRDKNNNTNNRKTECSVTSGLSLMTEMAGILAAPSCYSLRFLSLSKLHLLKRSKPNVEKRNYQDLF